MKEDIKKITMEDIIKGLGIEVGDIVKTGENVLICNDKYDLVYLATNRYSADIPNFILGMVSGKRDYSVFKVSSFIEYGATCK